MSDAWWIVAVVAALALASVSVRALVQLSADQRLGRLAVLIVSAALGVVLVGTVVSWSHWALGLVAGLAVVELGPTVLSVVRAVVRRKGGDT